MKIFPAVIADDSYFDLFRLFETSIRKTGFPFEPTRLYVEPHTVISGEKLEFLERYKIIHKTRPIGYERWGNWICCESYTSVLRDLGNDSAIGNDDYVMEADADTVMLKTTILNEIDGSDIIGLPTCGERVDFPEYGRKNWAHFSGCFFLFKGSFLKKFASVKDSVLLEVKDKIQNCGRPLFDDVFICFFGLMFGATIKELGGHHMVSNPESVILGKTMTDASIVHWYGDTGTWKTFLGIPVTGKRDLPRAIRESGINWP
jgi:hypothetical protein